MTLIYARVTKDIGFMVGDSLLTSEMRPDEPGPVNGQFHALKIQISADGRHALAFAGDAKIGNECCFATLSAIERGDAVDVPSYLVATYRAKREDAAGIDTDFLVMSRCESGFSLHEVTHGGVVQKERCYIGSQKGYRRLCEIRQRIEYQPPRVQMTISAEGSAKEEPLHVTQDEIEFEETALAMAVLCEERSVDGVGAITDGVVRVVDARASGEFSYMQMGYRQSDGTGHSMLASNSGRRGIGIYYLGGGVGFIFPVGSDQTCFRVTANSIEEFAELAREQFGLALSGAM